VRSAQALAALQRTGVTGALHLRGGIMAWAEQFEPDMAIY
jgi:adenylyltransferase/sulfurtransferase